MRPRRQILIARLIARDGADCAICRAPLGDDRTIDHWRPKARGGTNAIGNLRLAHYRCNLERGCPTAGWPVGQFGKHVRRTPVPQTTEPLAFPREHFEAP